jgi:hypothetical protein
MSSLYRSASVAALVVGLIWAFSQGAIAATVTITSEDFTGNAPLEGTPAPTSQSGNFLQSVTGSIAGVQLSPYAFNTGTGPDGSAAAMNAPYSVLDAGGGPVSSATYDVNSSSFTLLWGSPDSYNQVDFFSGANGMGSNLGEFSRTNLACGSSTCNQTGFDLVTFAASGGNIGSVKLTDSTTAAFEYGIPASVAATPLPGAIYLFGSVLGGAFWLGRRKRSAVSGLGSA